ncbi:imidazole glycerol phosphate synthase subunit HisH [Labrys monachus]|uniref:Imidazole glycerol phosphate synthase subunit HisH n=1 Tax=Labrys monachus TaxID=217067 RepID=A0ABU0FM02_9HYPH|nr:imidazole glycerol phosphate synthase subunit HisH [Labrys monachus]MDQ0395638.1 glutamine amidotransferase [Labrys monachus]
MGGTDVIAAIIDYGSGNLHSAVKAFERAAADSGLATQIRLTADPDLVAGADHIVLPGVGAYADCKRGLAAVDGMIEALGEAVTVRGRPFLGICVGMQLMSERGLEFETTEGLGWIGGDVTAIRPADPAFKVPHMGWNTLRVLRNHPVLEGIPTGPDGLHAYFVHSYHLAASDPGSVIAEADYGGPITAMVGRANMVGTQFHPEKSQALGLALIGNFLRWRP